MTTPNPGKTKHDVIPNLGCCYRIHESGQVFYYPFFLDVSACDKISEVEVCGLSLVENIGKPTWKYSSPFEYSWTFFSSHGVVALHNYTKGSPSEKQAKEAKTPEEINRWWIVYSAPESLDLMLRVFQYYDISYKLIN